MLTKWISPLVLHVWTWNLNEMVIHIFSLYLGSWVLYTTSSYVTFCATESIHIAMQFLFFDIVHNRSLRRVLSQLHLQKQWGNWNKVHVGLRSVSTTLEQQLWSTCTVWTLGSSISLSWILVFRCFCFPYSDLQQWCVCSYYYVEYYSIRVLKVWSLGPKQTKNWSRLQMFWRHSRISSMQISLVRCLFMVRKLSHSGQLWACFFTFVDIQNYSVGDIVYLCLFLLVEATFLWIEGLREGKGMSVVIPEEK